jgi:hypothetical protein
MAWLRGLPKATPAPEQPVPALSTRAASSTSTAGAASGAQTRCRTLARRHTPLDVAAPPPRPADFGNGTFLDRYSEWVVSKAVQTLGRPRVPRGLELTMASVCTGSAMDRVAAKALEDALALEGVDIHLRHMFNCDINKDKREFANRVHLALEPASELTCNYDNLVTLGHGGRNCSVHSKSCPLPESVDMLTGGLSCKDFARCRMDRLAGGVIYRSSSSPGRSADCMHGFLDLIDVLPPDALVVENVDELAEGLGLFYFCFNLLAPSPLALAHARSRLKLTPVASAGKSLA